MRLVAARIKELYGLLGATDLKAKADSGWLGRSYTPHIYSSVALNDSRYGV